MKNVTLTTEQQAVIRTYFKDYNKADYSSLAVFEVALEYFKNHEGTKKATLKSNLIKEFKACINSELLQTAFVSRLKKIIVIASEYSTFKIPYKDNEDEYKLYYYNIEQIVKLLSFVSQNEDSIEGNFKDIKKKLDTAISQELPKVAYNNHIKDVISKIKQENNIKGEHDDLSLAFDKIKGSLKSLSKEQLKELQQLISNLVD